MDQGNLDLCSLKKDKMTFNSEIIWDNTKPLFEIYFKEEIVSNKSRFADMEIELMDFNSALDFLKKM